MLPIVLYRASETSSEELACIHKYFPATDSRAKIPPNSLVIGRYSCLPFYQDLCTDLAYTGSRLINSPYEHEYVADLGSYVPDLGEFTFKTWTSLFVVPKEEAPFVLKGATNSMKHSWKTHMYAETWHDAINVQVNLQRDSLIGTQQIYIRKYENLIKLGTTLTGLPITKEFRFFVYQGEILSGGFYWDSYSEDLTSVPSPWEVPMPWLEEAISRVSSSVPFFAIDVAQTEAGEWRVVELNDGQMAGLSGNDPDEFYWSLKESFDVW